MEWTNYLQTISVAIISLIVRILILIIAIQLQDFTDNENDTVIIHVISSMLKERMQNYA